LRTSFPEDTDLYFCHARLPKPSPAPGFPPKYLEGRPANRLVFRRRPGFCPPCLAFSSAPPASAKNNQPLAPQKSACAWVPAGPTPPPRPRPRRPSDPGLRIGAQDHFISAFGPNCPGRAGSSSRRSFSEQLPYCLLRPEVSNLNSHVHPARSVAPELTQTFAGRPGGALPSNPQPLPPPFPARNSRPAAGTGPAQYPRPRGPSRKRAALSAPPPNPPCGRRTSQKLRPSWASLGGFAGQLSSGASLPVFHTMSRRTTRAPGRPASPGAKGRPRALVSARPVRPCRESCAVRPALDEDAPCDDEIAGKTAQWHLLSSTLITHGVGQTRRTPPSHPGAGS